MIDPNLPMRVKMKTKMACDVTALMLYSIDALPEDEVVSLANHVSRCVRCRKRLTDRDEFKAAIMALHAPDQARQTEPRA